jgi:hypothetical protein
MRRDWYTVEKEVIKAMKKKRLKIYTCQNDFLAGETGLVGMRKTGEGYTNEKGQDS